MQPTDQTPQPTPNPHVLPEQIGLMSPVDALTQHAQPEQEVMPQQVLMTDDQTVQSDSDGEGDRKLQGFRVGELGFVIEYIDGRELVEPPTLHHLPTAPGWLLGLANLHGSMIPVFDMARYFGIEASGEKKMLLVLGHDENAAGLLVDGLPKRITWNTEKQFPASSLPARAMPMVRSACYVGTELWLDLNVSALLDALEQGIQSQAA